MTLWLDKRVFEWEAYVSSGQDTEVDWNQPYYLVRHAERKLTITADRYERSDVIINLKRAVEIRNKHILSIYQIDQLNNLLPKRTFDKLEVLSICRPFLAKKLHAIRNDIEHNYVLPPELNECYELLEFVWYYLRSTDGLVHTQRHTILFREDAYELSTIELESGPKCNWSVKLSADISQKYVSDVLQNSWLTVEVESKEKRLEFLKRTNSKDQISKNLPQDNILIRGVVNTPVDALFIISKFFSII